MVFKLPSAIGFCIACNHEELQLGAEDGDALGSSLGALTSCCVGALPVLHGFSRLLSEGSFV